MRSIRVRLVDDHADGTYDVIVQASGNTTTSLAALTRRELKTLAVAALEHLTAYSRESGVVESIRFGGLRQLIVETDRSPENA